MPLVVATLLAPVPAFADGGATSATSPCNGTSGRMYVACALAAVLSSTGAAGVGPALASDGNDGAWFNTGSGYTLSNPRGSASVSWSVDGAKRAAVASDTGPGSYRSGAAHADATYFYGVHGRNYLQRRLNELVAYSVGAPEQGTTFTVFGQVDALRCHRVGATRHPATDCPTMVSSDFNPANAYGNYLSVSGSNVTVSQSSYFDLWSSKRTSYGMWAPGPVERRSAQYSFVGTVTDSTVNGTVTVTIGGHVVHKVRVSGHRTARTWVVSSSSL